MINPRPGPLAWICERVPRVVGSLMTTRQLALFMLYACYIWDLIRREYIDSRERKYQHHKQKRRNYLIYEPTTDEQYDTEFECPIRPMPKFQRSYQIFSTIFIFYTTVKHIALCTIHCGWFDIDKTYTCYLPGRLGLFVDEGFVYELPWLGLIIYSYHLIWRTMWFYSKPFEVECLLFLFHDKDIILRKQYELIDLNSITTRPDAVYRKYLCNSVFYRRKTTTHGRIIHVMKQNRTIEYREQLENLTLLLKWSTYVIFVVSVSIICYGVYTQFRHDHFDMTYSSCRSFSSFASDANFAWSFDDTFRLSYLFFDLFENLILLLDTTLGLSFPIGAAMVMTHDLCLRFDALRERVRNLNDLFRSSHCFGIDLNMRIDFSKMTHEALKFLEDIQEESESIFDETVSTFEQIEKVDVYMRRLSSFTIFVWLILNASYQASLILKLLPEGSGTVFNRFASIFVYVGLIICYIIFARPNHRAQLLYKELCIAMAVSPNIPKTKIAWRWLLEYYNRAGRFSLHLLGKSYTLSNLNTLRCASWFVTCTMIIFSLLKH